MPRFDLIEISNLRVAFAIGECPGHFAFLTADLLLGSIREEEIASLGTAVTTCQVDWEPVQEQANSGRAAFFG